MRAHVNNTINEYLGGLRSTMTYVGTKYISNLYKNVKCRLGRESSYRR